MPGNSEFYQLVLGKSFIFSVLLPYLLKDLWKLERHCVLVSTTEAAERFKTWGGLIVHKVKHIPLVYSYFPKCLLRCSFARTNFFIMSTVSSVSVIDLRQCRRRQLFRRF